MLLDACTHRIWSLILQTAHEICEHLEWALCMNAQLCVVTCWNICFSSLPLDFPQGFMCLLECLRLSLLPDLVKSVGWPLGYEAWCQYLDLALVEPYPCPSTLSSAQSLELSLAPVTALCQLLKWLYNLYGCSFINLCMLRFLSYLFLLCFLLCSVQLLFFSKFLLQLLQLLFCFLHPLFLS